MVKKVAAFHDISGYGRSSLTVVIPILSAMGCYVCPVPTAVLSSSTAFPSPYTVDLTSHLRKILSHWKELDIKFDAIYSGYLGSPDQCRIVADMIRDFKVPGQVVLVDPVLGDDGSLYPTMGPTMVENMRKLVTHADIITPNVTEACLLLGERYQEKIEEYTIKSYAFRLSHQGPKNVVITSVSGKDTHSRYVMAYNKTSDKYFRVDIDYFPIEYPGAGDTFASVLCGAMLQGKSLEEAVTDATDFVYESIKVSFGEDYDSREGMLQEKMICRRSL